MGIVSAGILDQRITIQELTVVRGALGGHDETWSTLATVWAQKLDMTGREIFQAKAMGSAATLLITIRYRPDVKASMRVVFSDGSMARIEWIRHVTRKERLELYCLKLDG
ncbi:MAG: phage head closure protein [Alphaproteobacteria bacterium]|nr:phage head closure protein [Alphaproteobacteria bacterium]